jgi:DNA-directed RNA polymerase specialized sigma24 family protein
LFETIEWLLRPFGERDQEIVRLRLIGHRTDEIAAAVGRSQYTVQSVLRRAKKRLERVVADG